MNSKDSHYFSKHPGGKIKIHTISASLRKHLYLFKTIPGVFSYRKIDLGTKVFIKNMYIPQEPTNLLDLGCGYGVIGIVLGYESPESIVYLTDINQRAIWCTKENLKLNLPNSGKRMVVLEGNFLEPLQDNEIQLDGIFMNPALRRGRDDFLQLFQEIPHYLKEKGFFQFVIRKKMGAGYIQDYLNSHFDDTSVEIICKRSGYWVFYCTFRG